MYTPALINDLQSIPEMQVLLVRQVLERKAIALSLIQVQVIPTLVLPVQENVQHRSRRNGYTIATEMLAEYRMPHLMNQRPYQIINPVHSSG